MPETLLSVLRAFGLLIFASGIIIEFFLFRYNLTVGYRGRSFRECRSELALDWLKYLALNAFYILMIWWII